jgi:hypothetical protein
MNTILKLISHNVKLVQRTLKRQEATVLHYIRPFVEPQFQYCNIFIDQFLKLIFGSYIQWVQLKF